MFDSILLGQPELNKGGTYLLNEINSFFLTQNFYRPTNNIMIY